MDNSMSQIDTVSTVDTIRYQRLIPKKINILRELIKPTYPQPHLFLQINFAVKTKPGRE